MGEVLLPPFLRATGLFLIFIYSVSTLFDIIPIKLLQPDWIFNAVQVFVNGVSIPIVGIALVHLSSFLSASDKQLKVQLKIARLAALLGILFLLMLPMLAFSVRQNLVSLQKTNQEQIVQFNQKGSEIIAAINASSSFDELRSRLITLNGPQLNPESRGVDLNELKKKLIEGVKAIQSSAPGRLLTPTSPTYLDFYKRVLRVSFLALIASITFFSLAWSPVSQQNIIISYFQNLGFFGFKPSAVMKQIFIFMSSFQARQKEKMEMRQKRKFALQHQRQIRRAEMYQMRDEKRRQMEERKRAQKLSEERERMLELERKMQRKNELKSQHDKSKE